MESVAGGLPRLLAWCSVVRLDASWLEMGAEGARMLAGVLGQCSALAELDLTGNDIGAEGARILLDAKLPGLRNLYYHSI